MVEDFGFADIDTVTDLAEDIMGVANVSCKAKVNVYVADCPTNSPCDVLVDN